MSALKVNVFCIARSCEFESQISYYEKLISKYTSFTSELCFSSQIQKAQAAGKQKAQAAYAEIFAKKQRGFSVALDPMGTSLDTKEFSKILENQSEISFFVGGAFGFGENFLKTCQKIISLSELTFSHSLARLVLCEQIYRGFSILNNHPYHKN